MNTENSKFEYDSLKVPNQIKDDVNASMKRVIQKEDENNKKTAELAKKYLLLLIIFFSTGVCIALEDKELSGIAICMIAGFLICFIHFVYIKIKGR